jgi:DNA-binding response OmpR family regulator
MKKPLAFIIEDDKHLAAAFEEALSEAGYEIEIIYDGKTAIQRLADTIPVIIILDLHIPLISGTEVLKQVRGEPRLKDTRVVIATADHQKAEILSKEIDLVLFKPIGYRQLRDLTVGIHPNKTDGNDQEN